MEQHLKIIAETESAVRSRLTQLLAELQGRLRRGDLTRESVVQAFNQFRSQLPSILEPMDRLLLDTVRIYREIDTIEDSVIAELADAVRSIASATVQSSTDSAQSTILQTVLLAGIVGTPPVLLINSIIDRMESLSRNLSNTAADTVFNADSTFGIALGQQLGVERYTYVGPGDTKTRAWCAGHLNRTYTLKEIQDLWANNTWGGKAPGDPMTVRGGYNCRHFWMPKQGEA